MRGSGVSGHRHTGRERDEDDDGQGEPAARKPSQARGQRRCKGRDHARRTPVAAIVWPMFPFLPPNVNVPRHRCPCRCRSGRVADQVESARWNEREPGSEPRTDLGRPATSLENPSRHPCPRQGPAPLARTAARLGATSRSQTPPKLRPELPGRGGRASRLRSRISQRRNLAARLVACPGSVWRSSSCSFGEVPAEEVLGRRTSARTEIPWPVSARCWRPGPRRRSATPAGSWRRGTT